MKDGTRKIFLSLPLLSHWLEFSYTTILSSKGDWKICFEAGHHVPG